MSILKHELQEWIQKKVEHLKTFEKNSWRFSSVNYFCKKFHFRCLTGFWIPLTNSPFLFILWKFPNPFPSRLFRLPTTYLVLPNITKSQQNKTLSFHFISFIKSFYRMVVSALLYSTCYIHKYIRSFIEVEHFRRHHIMETFNITCIEYPLN